ncbi:hypothetical protein FVW27_05145, partial [Desulfovibrio sp. XJ01]|nr:hypothetical protein [Nitratidesulfovibrio liaohensis]
MSRVPRESHIPKETDQADLAKQDGPCGKGDGREPSRPRSSRRALRTSPVAAGLIGTGLFVTGLALAALPLLPPGGATAVAEMRQSQGVPP